jgi:erythronate-4-phosphate dehydrogenase
MSLRILADENMPGLETFAGHGDLITAPGRGMTRERVLDADVLLVRSVTRVDRALLQGTRVGFVGSATIGTDHVDREWLDRAGIAFAHAPGCNAMAVAEYDLQAVLDWLEEQGRDPARTRVAVIGCGNTGRRAATLFRAAGLDVLACDPPLWRAGGELPGTPVSLDDALEADVITLHVPLTGSGPDATRHLLGEERLARLQGGQLLINTSRGSVIDNRALRARLGQGGPATVLDVWEGEPEIDPGLFRVCRTGTPHVAGYSLQGKLRGTAMLYDAFRQWQDLEPAPVRVAPPMESLDQPVKNPADVLTLLRRRYDLRRDHRALAESLGSEARGEAFDRLRREYPVRNECAGLVVTGPVEAGWRRLLSELGVAYRS